MMKKIMGIILVVSLLIAAYSIVIANSYTAYAVSPQELSPDIFTSPQFIQFKINYFKQNLPSLLPKGVSFVIQEDKKGGIAVFVKTPNDYTKADMERLNSIFKQINKMCKSAWEKQNASHVSDKTYSTIKSEPYLSTPLSSSDYKVVGYSGYPLYYISTAFNSTVYHRPHYGVTEIQMESTATGNTIIYTSAINYQFIQVGGQEEIWSTQISLGWPPSVTRTYYPQSYESPKSLDGYKYISYTVPTLHLYAVNPVTVKQTNWTSMTYTSGRIQTTDTVTTYASLSLTD